MNVPASTGDAVGAPRPSGPVLAVAGLHVSFRVGKQWVPVVRDVSLEVAAGETLGLVGESGCGKSVTGLSIMGLLPDRVGRVDTGRIELEGQPLLGLSERALADVRGARAAMVFQEPMTSLDPAFTVGRQVAEVVRRHTRATRREAWRRAVELLELVGIPDPHRRARDYPHRFSGGMRQRVLIAIAVACEPRLLIADEPTTALDVTTQAQILELFRDLQARMGMAVLFITHDLGVVADLCDRVAVMYAGEVVEEASTDDVFHSPRHPYTAALLACTPREHGGEPLTPISGNVPMPRDYPGGCRFHPRCAHREEGSCTTGLIQLSATDAAHSVRCARADQVRLHGVGA